MTAITNAVRTLKKQRRKSLQELVLSGGDTAEFFDWLKQRLMMLRRR